MTEQTKKIRSTPSGAPVSRRQHRIGIVLVALAGAFWSLGGVIVRLMDTEDAWVILLYRSVFVVASLGLFIVIRDRMRGVSSYRSIVDIGMPGIVAGVGIALAFTGFVLALVNTSVANAFFLLATQPFMVAALAWLVLRERLNPVTLAAGLVALVGVVIMVHESLDTGTIVGNLAGLLSAVGFSVFTVALRAGRHVDMLPAMLGGGLLSGSFAFVMLWQSGSGPGISTHDLAWCALLGISQIGLGTLAYIAGSRWVKASELSLLAMTEIVLGPVWVWLVINEVPARGTMTGGAILLVALLMVSIYQLIKGPAAESTSR